MRKDPELTRTVGRSEDWKFDVNTGEQNADIVQRYTRGSVDRDGSRFYHSFSGHERNRFFLNHHGERFTDISAISGLDNIADGRAFVLWDFDRDGWQDIALVNANTPLLNIYRNEIGSRAGGNNSASPPVIAVRFVGGNRTAKPSREFGPRDGYGAMATVVLADMTLKREHRCGEGFAAQNSATMLIGIGNRSVAKSVVVRWPSGKTQSIENVRAGTLLTAYENATDSPDGSGFTSQQYVRPSVAERRPDVKVNGPDRLLSVVLDSAPAPASASVELRMYTTMATWCAACKRHLPQLAHLRSLFSASELEMYGVPADPIDSREKLVEYSAKHRPAYQMLSDISSEDRTRVLGVIRTITKSEALPSTIVTNRDGKVLACFPGVPTASEVARLRDTSPVQTRQRKNNFPD